MSKETCKFNLNVATRLMLLMNLPEQGSVTEMISKRNVRKKIDFSSKEVDDYKIHSEEGRVVWDPKAASVEIEFTESEVNFLKDLVNKMDESKGITDNFLDFVEEIRK